MNYPGVMIKKSNLAPNKNVLEGFRAMFFDSVIKTSYIINTINLCL